MAHWFLDTLGLDAAAGERDIKRAYAQRLKEIDPATDPAAFAQLRQAFEAARSWAAATPGDVAPAAEAMPAVDPPVAMRHDRGSEAALASLASVLANEPATRAADALAQAVDGLRQGHVDALPRFEGLLVDALANQQLARQTELATAAITQLGWHETGGHHAGTEQDAWIGRLVGAQAAWKQFPENQRRVLLQAIDAAIAEGEALSPVTVRAWVRISTVEPYVGAWLRLRLPDDTRAAWRAAFRALPRDTRDAAEADAWDPAILAVPRWKRIFGFLWRRALWVILIARLLLMAIRAMRGHA